MDRGAQKLNDSKSMSKQVSPEERQRVGIRPSPVRLFYLNAYTGQSTQYSGQCTLEQMYTYTNMYTSLGILKAESDYGRLKVFL